MHKLQKIHEYDRRQGIVQVDAGSHPPGSWQHIKRIGISDGIIDNKRIAEKQPTVYTRYDDEVACKEETIMQRTMGATLS